MTHLYPKQIIFLHKQIIAITGGSHGVRDKGLLESAVYRPQASFGGRDLYPDLYLKAAALCHSIICNHPFIDGNKRVGFEAMRLMLRLNGHDIKASVNKKFDFAMNIAKSEMTEQDIVGWISKYAFKIS